MFYKDKRRKDGLHSFCKNCHNNICINYHHSDKYVKYQNDYELNRYKNDIQYRKQQLLRGGLTGAIKLNSIKGKAVKTLGCPIFEFKKYIESKWKEGMTWDNWSKEGWHLDHIKPLCLFDLTKEKDYYKAGHYTNIQPLWARENIQKGNSF